ncbi:MAG: transglutaminase domain-containing protein, partial [Proteobacteria bacterium]|nr:transglutaminase domain-containing protein [Pseudomonadota bacterium]
MIDAGQFKAADAAIDRALAQADDRAQTTALQFQRERMRRILLDFSLDAGQVEALIRKQIPDLTDDEFAYWDARGYIEHRMIDGRTRYFDGAAGNLFLLSAEARARRAHPQPFDDSPLQTAGAYHAEVIRDALATHRNSVDAQRVRVTQSLTVKPDAVPAGETVKAWIP